MTMLYLLLGIALVGALFYALMQITARQQRLNAEMTRLERLAAEVSMNADAILEQVDARIDRLNDLVELAESRIPARLSASVAADIPQPEAKPAPALARPQEHSPIPGTSEAAAPDPTTAVGLVAHAPEPPASVQRYQELREAARALAAEGLSPVEIAQRLEIPRGEVLLLLNLRSRKVTA